jgi:hypothetical protein
MSWPSVFASTPRAERGIHRVEIFDLVVKIAVGSRVKIAYLLPLDQNFQEKSEEVEIPLRGCE